MNMQARERERERGHSSLHVVQIIPVIQRSTGVQEVISPKVD